MALISAVKLHRIANDELSILSKSLQASEKQNKPKRSTAYKSTAIVLPELF